MDGGGELDEFHFLMTLLYDADWLTTVPIARIADHWRIFAYDRYLARTREDWGVA